MAIIAPDKEKNMSEQITALNNAERATVLVEALPYIQKYYGKIIVVKYGGNAMINEELKHDVMRDMVLMSLIGVKVVLDMAAVLKSQVC